MTLATKEQVKAVNATLAKIGQMPNKAEIVSNYTNQRTTHSSELTTEEARGLLTALTRGKQTVRQNSKPSQHMVNKLFAMAHEMGWITTKAHVSEGSVKKVKDYSRVHDWVQKYGWKKQPLKEYTYEEMPKLVSIFEFKVYKSYLANLRK